MLELKTDKGTKYIIGWKLKGLHNSKLIGLNDVFLTNVKYFGNKIGIQFHNTTLVIEQINYARKILNVYLVYDLDNWPENPLRNFTLKNRLFGVTNIVKNSDKKSMCIPVME